MELRIRDLSKMYGDKTAVDNISYEFQPGVYGLLGANGAGKSTLINLLTNNIPRNKGEILWNGHEILDLKNYYSDIGYMPQSQGYYKYMSSEEFLIYIARLKGINKKEAVMKSEELLKQVNLFDVRKKSIGALSGGMKQRVMLAQSLLNDPKILILDEPTAGVDPEERISIRNYISNIAKDRIVLIATHIVSDIEAISREVLLMKDGKIVTSGTPSALIQKVAPFIYEITTDYAKLSEINQKYMVSNLRYAEEGLVAKVISEETPNEQLVRKGTTNLEDVYLYYCKK